MGDHYTAEKVHFMAHQNHSSRSYHLCWGGAWLLGLTALAACSSPELAQAKGDGASSNKAQICAPAKLPDLSPAGMAQEVICLKTADKTIAITVEIAQTPQEQARGLMFRTELSPNKGMLFPFPSPKQASFWMKNTYIPLDIIYVQSDGTIESIAADAEPTSLTPILSKGKVSFVLELAGGRAAELGLRPGDSMRRAP